MKKWLSLFILMAGVSLCASEYSADFIMQDKSEGIHSKGRLYFKGGNMRQEMNSGGMRTITIIRPSEHKSWMLQPDQNTYMEMSQEDMQGAVGGADWTVEDERNAKFLGHEKVNKYTCKKYLIQDEGGEAYVWVSEELRVPIKIMGQNYQYELVNIKKERVSDSLFQVPTGYQKFQLPNFKIPGGANF
ncbi:MAG: DUF4412 domain-containing protein [Sulfurospirillaceae bacterium]|nr:DUF4412 domain-containing protein [Sulfurospirillaceae bacterium]MDD3462584.1 DUF4412 domain-containing protein [Sulfurospirillaceae bacterium]